MIKKVRFEHLVKDINGSLRFFDPTAVSVNDSEFDKHERRSAGRYMIKLRNMN